MILEICASTIESALNAQNGGADRIELCTHLEVGGLTPSHGMIVLARELVDLPIHVLIRPRAGSFVYSALELEQMKEDIKFCQEVGCEGVVIGVLNPDRTVNENSIRMLIEAGAGLDVTFHRAFDEVPNPFDALESLVTLDVNRLLTSGQASTAIGGYGLIESLLKEADGEITIMPGGGVRPENIANLLSCGASEFHSSAINEGERHSNLDTIQQLANQLSSSPHSSNS